MRALMDRPTLVVPPPGADGVAGRTGREFTSGGPDVKVRVMCWGSPGGPPGHRPTRGSSRRWELWTPHQTPDTPLEGGPTSSQIPVRLHTKDRHSILGALVLSYYICTSLTTSLDTASVGTTIVTETPPSSVVCILDRDFPRSTGATEGRGQDHGRPSAQSRGGRRFRGCRDTRDSGDERPDSRPFPPDPSGPRLFMGFWWGLRGVGSPHGHSHRHTE